MLRPARREVETRHVSLFKPLLAVISLVLIVFVASVLLLGFYLRESASVPVYSFHITNITPNSATIVWRTDEPVIGTVMLMESDEKSVSDYVKALSFQSQYYDTRDIEEQDDGTVELHTVRPYYTHHVTVADLSPEKEYNFVILHNRVFSQHQLLDTIKTPAVSESVREPEPVYGRITSDDIDLGDTVVLARLEERSSADVGRARSSMISSTIGGGSYVMDVAHVYTDDLSQAFPSLLQNLQQYTITLEILVPGGSVKHTVVNENIQPVDIISIYRNAVSSSSVSYLDAFISKARAQEVRCRSECVGDCQGCNLETEGNPACITYGCGYMEWCCGTGSDAEAGCANHCINGVKDCEERGVDCGGGGCSTCENLPEKCQDDPAGPCKQYGEGECGPVNPVTGNCKCAVNEKKDADEDDIDCGGMFCPDCDNAGSHCFDGKKNQDEDGVDCGGSCAASCTMEGSNEEVNFNEECAPNGAVFTCGDRPDWYCICYGGTARYYQEKNAGDDDVGSTTNPDAVGQESGFEDEPGTSGGGGGSGSGVSPGSGICTGGQSYTSADGKSCCRGTCLEVCTWYEGGVQKSATHYYNSGAECPAAAGDLFMSWDDTSNHVKNALWKGEWATQDSSWMCAHVHTWSQDPWNSYPEHEGLCIKSGGGGAGVGAGNGQKEGSFKTWSLVSPARAASEEVAPGIYDVSGVNVDISTTTIEVHEPGTITFFFDENGNGIHDPGEQYMTDAESAAYEIELQKSMDGVMYMIVPGWNALSFPLVMNEEGSSMVVTAGDIIDFARGKGVNINHIAAYRNHEFLIYSKRVDEGGNVHEFGTDYALLPGEGYFVKSNSSGSLFMVGFQPAGSMNIILHGGWNLVGFYKEGTESFDAFALLDQMKAQSLPADILTKWENSRYESVIDDGGSRYGNDFLVFPKYAYWTRIQSDGADEAIIFAPD